MAVKEKPHILMLEDEPIEAERVVSVLRKGGLSLWLDRVQTQEQFERALDERRPDVILSDSGSPEFDDLSALSVAKSKRPDVPFILVTGSAMDPLTLEG